MVTRAERDFVTERAESRCEYCRAPQRVTAATFHIEHIIPTSRGGRDDQTNYALSCMTCNGHKADNITGIDSETGEKVPLFHPRRDKWERHFRFVPKNFQIKGITPKGRATVTRLLMDEKKQTDARELWIELGIYP